MANGVSGTKGAGGNTQPMQQAAQNTAPVQQASTNSMASKKAELEALHQKVLDNMKANNSKNPTHEDMQWDKGYEDGSREVLSDLLGESYGLQGYKLVSTGKYDPVSVNDIEKNLNKSLQAYEYSAQSTGKDAYYMGAINTLEKATGNKYYIDGYKLKKSTATSTSNKPPAAVNKNFKTGYSANSVAQSYFDIATKDKAFYDKYTKPFIDKVKSGKSKTSIKTWTDNVLGKAIKKYNTDNGVHTGLYTGEAVKWIGKIKEYYGML